MWKNSLKHMFKWKKTISMVWFSLRKKTDKTTGWIQLYIKILEGKSNWGRDWESKVECFRLLYLLFKLCQWFVHALIVYILKTKKIKGRTFLVIQWLRLQASKAGNKGLIPGQGNKIPHAAQQSQKGSFLSFFFFFKGKNETPLWREALKSLTNSV